MVEHWAMDLWILAVFYAGAGFGFWMSYRWCKPKWERLAIRRWYPPAEMAQAMFPRDEELERLALRRELHDNGRLYPSRTDAGRPARLHKAKARGKRSTL